MHNLKRKPLRCDGYFDIETQDWDKFVVGCFMTATGHRIWWHDDEEGMIDAMLDFEGYVYAHNGGRYDGLWFLNKISQRGIKAECATAGQRVICIRVRKLRIYDSAAIIPLPLKDAARIGRFSKDVTGLQCKCGRQCGGYCAIRRRGMSAVNRAKLEAYLVLDCKSGWSMLQELENFAALHDIDICSTIGASSWRTALRWGNVNADTESELEG